MRFFIKYYLFSTLADKRNMNYFDVLGGNSLLSAKYEFVRHLSARMTSTDCSEKGINTARIQTMADRIPVLVLDTSRAKSR